jgi:hypothetical protein
MFIKYQAKAHAFEKKWFHVQLRQLKLRKWDGLHKVFYISQYSISPSVRVRGFIIV